ncbi:sensor histidine kinase [Limnobacter sp.]|uniref:sensor histidine kinase n=1 Tax=Limnobacter sp. TaxID=2003368 RepID=UPI002FDF98BF
MLRLLIQLLSFVTGQRLLTPDQAKRQQLELEDLRSKQIALEALSNKLRGEMKRQQSMARDALKSRQIKLERVISAKQNDIDSLNETLKQLSQSVDFETQRQIKENTDLLAQLNWLSGTIAHDFRAPLRAIDAYTFFLADDLGDTVPPEAEKSLEEIRRNGKRMGVLLDALIEYLRLGVCPLNIQPHDLGETLTQVINEHFDFSPVPIELQVQGQWRFDKPLMMRTFKELIDNAIKFSRDTESPKIIIRQSSPHCLEIIDTGVGFAEEHKAQKFQLFHRMHGNDEFKGEGIGLATAERIASRHHIALRLNRVGSQTVVSLQLPETLNP